MRGEDLFDLAHSRWHPVAAAATAAATGLSFGLQTLVSGRGVMAAADLLSHAGRMQVASALRTAHSNLHTRTQTPTRNCILSRPRPPGGGASGGAAAAAAGSTITSAMVGPHLHRPGCYQRVLPCHFAEPCFGCLQHARNLVTTPDVCRRRHRGKPWSRPNCWVLLGADGLRRVPETGQGRRHKGETGVTRS